VETLICYIPLELQDLWKSLNGYLTQNWATFRVALEAIYKDISAESRHSEHRLIDFVCQSFKMHISNKGNVLWYYYEFLPLSQPLLGTQQLTVGMCNKLFWQGFHPKDCSEMHAQLLAKHPDQPSNVAFDYLDVYKVAKATFSGEDLLDLDWNDSWDEPQGLRANHSEHAQECQFDQQECNPRAMDPSYRTFDYRHHPCSTNPTTHEALYRQPKLHHSPPPEAKTQVHHFREPIWEKEDQEIEDLIDCMHGLSVHKKSYVALYGQCIHQFPNVAQTLLKPTNILNVPVPVPVATTAFSLQTLAPAPLRQQWPTAASTPHVLPPPTDPSVFFHSHIQTKGCSFCFQLGHYVWECPSAKEYMHTGHAMILGECLYLLNGQPITNNGIGHGLKQSIDTWLAAQP
jgi:hypothetical protein